jgi:hypothetical protein
MRRDIVRERMAAVQEDLNEFSALQMRTFIDGIKEKQRQREILAKAGEQDL